MRRIVEAQHGQVAGMRKFGESERLGARHVRQEARQPKQSEVGARRCVGQAISEAAAFAGRAHLEKLRFLMVHL